MAISTGAIASLIAIAIIVIISCIRETNVGFLAIAAGLVIGILFLAMKPDEVFSAWPASLFMTLLGVTFMFSCATVNGTIEKLSSYSIRLVKNRVILIPFIIFALVVIITTVGPGNIVTVALFAPVVMAIAGRIGLSAFAMTLLVVAAANGAAFSPFAPTGIISNGLIAQIAPALGIASDQLPGLGWQIDFKVFITQTIVNGGGFLLLGGAAWMRRQRGKDRVDIEEIAPLPDPFTKKQLATLAGIALLIIMVIFFKWDVGVTAFFIGAAFLLLGIADDTKAVREVPWGVIVMVCGMALLINIMDKSGGLNVLTTMIGAVSNPTSVNGVLALITGVLSSFSSSSGVVLPMFLPMVPGVIAQIGGGDPISLISSINVGSHIVDTSPLSTLGALCLSFMAANENKSKVFRNLLIWGFSMSFVGAIACYVIFGLFHW